MELCGRNNELRILAERWRRASDMDNPQTQIVVVCGEPGLGKTRLAMETFELLRREEEGLSGGFWPALSFPEGGNIQVNPNFAMCSFKDNEIPFLWWGIRAGDVHKENSVHGDAIANYQKVLLPQLAALTLWSRYIKNGLAKLATTWAEFIKGELVGTLSGVGPLLEFGKTCL